MEPASRSDEVFIPHVVYYEETGTLQAIFLDRSADPVMVEAQFDVLKNNNVSSNVGAIVGFSLRGVLGILHTTGYRRKSITLKQLLVRFEKNAHMPYGKSVFGKYRKEVYEWARKHNIVWKIPQ